VNQKTGEFFVFGYSTEKPVIHYTLFDKNRKMVNKLDVQITSKRMIHDLAITENFVIFPDLPMEFGPEKVIRENKGPVFRWDTT